MKITPGVPSSSNIFNILVEAALVEAPIFQITSPLPPIFRHFLQNDLEPTISPALSAAFRSNTFAFHGTLPVPFHIQPLLRAPEPNPLARLPASSSGNTSAAENAQAIIIVVGNAAVENPS